LFRKYPDLWEVAMSKKRVWQVHSPRNTKWVDLTAGLKDKQAKHLVIGQYHPRQWPECKIVPNVIDIWDEKLMPHWGIRNEIPRVVYSPSRIGLSGWDDKGYKETQPILQKLVDVGMITAEIIYNTPYAECLAKRKKADIAIDELVTGSYHLCSLESLSAGLVTFAGLDDIQINTLKDLTGAEELPWVVARPETLVREFTKLLVAGGPLGAARRKARAWMEKYWEPEVTTEKFLRIYESL